MRQLVLLLAIESGNIFWPKIYDKMFFILKKPLSYNTLNKLVRSGFVKMVKEEKGRRKGYRVSYRITDEGQEFLSFWIGAIGMATARRKTIFAEEEKG